MLSETADKAGCDFAHPGRPQGARRRRGRELAAKRGVSGAALSELAGRWRAIILALAGLWLVTGCRTHQLMPTPNLYQTDLVNPFAAVIPECRTNRVDVLYLTDRQPEAYRADYVDYGHKRSFSVAYGSAVVRIGKDVTWETLVQNSRLRKRTHSMPVKLVQVQETGRFPNTPGPLVATNGELRLDPVYLDAVELAEQQFHGELRRRLARTPRKEVFMLIHGYHNRFERPAEVLAELWHFLGRQGVPVLYSWPAGRKGFLRGYTYDRESGEFTLFHLKQAIRVIAACAEVEKIHLLSHSRGTDIAASALRELEIEERRGGVKAADKYKIGNVVLAAPDLDVQVLGQRLGAEHVFDGAERITVYVSAKDKAIWIAGWLFDSVRRLGRVRPEDFTSEQKEQLASLHGFEFVDAQISTGFINHGYFHSNPAVSSDLILLLRDNRPPGPEHGRPLTRVLDNFWRLTKGYPAVRDGEPGTQSPEAEAE